MHTNSVIFDTSTKLSRSSKTYMINMNDTTRTETIHPDAVHIISSDMQSNIIVLAFEVCYSHQDFIKEGGLVSEHYGFLIDAYRRATALWKDENTFSHEIYVEFMLVGYSGYFRTRLFDFCDYQGELEIHINPVFQIEGEV